MQIKNTLKYTILSYRRDESLLRQERSAAEPGSALDTFATNIKMGRSGVYFPARDSALIKRRI